MSGYVYHKQLVSPQELQVLIENLSNQSYYFLRYSHTVSGICTSIPALRGETEGQMFNATREVRWKKYKSGYEILVLSQQQENLEGFKPLDINWEICDHNAYWHDQNETKFPKGFIFQGVEPSQIPIQQRYFIDSTTATVHFVALTVKENDSNSKTPTTETSTSPTSNAR